MVLMTVRVVTYSKEISKIFEVVFRYYIEVSFKYIRELEELWKVQMKLFLGDGLKHDSKKISKKKWHSIKNNIKEILKEKYPLYKT